MRKYILWCFVKSTEKIVSRDKAREREIVAGRVFVNFATIHNIFIEFIHIELLWH